MTRRRQWRRRYAGRTVEVHQWGGKGKLPLTEYPWLVHGELGTQVVVILGGRDEWHVGCQLSDLVENLIERFRYESHEDSMAELSPVAEAFEREANRLRAHLKALNVGTKLPHEEQPASERAEAGLGRNRSSDD